MSVVRSSVSVSVSTGDDSTRTRRPSVTSSRSPAVSFSCRPSSQVMSPSCNNNTNTSTLPPSLEARALLRLAAFDEFAFARLFDGAVFIKHSRRSKAHYRHVRCNGDGAIEWSALSTPYRRVSTSAIALRDITAIEYGHVTAAFASAPAQSNPRLCVSIITAARTLDLEALNAHDFHIFTAAIHTAMQQPQRRMQTADMTLAEFVNKQTSATAPPQQPPPPPSSSQSAILKPRSLHHPAISEVEAASGARVMRLKPTVTTSASTMAAVESLPPRPPALSDPAATIAALRHWLQWSQSECALLSRHVEQYRDDNRRLMISYEKQKSAMQNEIDKLRRRRAPQHALDDQCLQASMSGRVASAGRLIVRI